MSNSLGAILRDGIARSEAVTELWIYHRKRVAMLASRTIAGTNYTLQALGEVSDACVRDYNAAVCAAGLGLGFCIIPDVEPNGIGLFCHCEGCQE